MMTKRDYIIALEDTLPYIKLEQFKSLFPNTSNEEWVRNLAKKLSDFPESYLKDMWQNVKKIL